LHPELIVPIRKECDELGRIDYDTYKSLLQTTAALQEGLRLHPSVPKNAWQAVSDDQIPNGPRIEKGDVVFWSDWGMGRDRLVWGPDAAEYKPSRWIDETGSLKKESQFKAHFFNGGSRQ
jgi:cytochrome P450